MDTEALCGTHPWGPWDDGNLTLCFLDSVGAGVHVGWLLLLGTLRLVQVRRRYLDLNMGGGWAYLGKVILCLVQAALYALKVGGNLFVDTAEPYELLGDVLLTIGWAYAAVIAMMEHSRGVPQTWVMRGWWLMAFVLASVRLQTAVVLIEHNGWQWDFVVFFVQFAICGAVCILGLWFNDAPVLRIYERLKQQHPGGKAVATYSTFVPNQDDRFPGGNAESAEDRANFLSQLTFWWFNPLLFFGYEHPLVMDDLWKLARQDESAHFVAAFRRAWDSQAASLHSLPRALVKAFGLPFLVAGCYKFVNDILVFAGPVLLNRLIGFVQDDSKPLYYGLGLAAAMFVLTSIQTLAVHQYFNIGYRVGMHIRGSVVVEVYRKAFRQSASARQQSTVGEIVNLMSLDAQRLMDLIPYLHMVWSSFVQIGISLVLLWQVVGVATFGGVAVMVLLIPLNSWLARVQGAIQKEMMTCKDNRTKIVNEVLQGIRVIKFFAWESSFNDKIGTIRADELRTLKKSAYLKVITMFFWTSTPLFVSVITFTTYTLLGNTLDAETAFTALALFNVLRFPLNMLPQVISSLVEAHVSVKRISAYLLSEELDPNAVLRLPPPEEKKQKQKKKKQQEKKQKDKKQQESEEGGEDLAIRVTNGCFAWDSNPSTPVTLQDINISVQRGSLVAVVGAVGSGKSALLSALLGDSHKRAGQVMLSGSVALVTQQAWIQNATLQDNILYGDPYDHARYETCVKVCELRQDVAMLPSGDMTEIGEKGINLSGGQKQRISLARAVYADRDIYFLDDPLSAVDAHVGKAIFENCIRDQLRDKTRVLVTHQLQYLADVDQIIVLKDGRIVEMGTYHDLMLADREFARLINTHVKPAPASSDAGAVAEDDAADAAHAAGEEQPGLLSSSTSSLSSSRGPPAEKQPLLPAPAATVTVTAPAKPVQKLIAAEERDIGSVGWEVYRQYTFAVGGLLLVGSILLLYLIDQSAQIGGNWWLSHWSTQPNAADEVYFYLGIYAALGGASTAFVFVRSLLSAVAGLNAAETLHDRLVQRVLRAPMAFFDTTPVGRILNRFSKDIYTVDEQLPNTMRMFLNTLFSSLGIVIVICVVTPWFLCALIPLGKIYHAMQQYYVRSSREIKRLDSISRSPIYAHFSETLAGISTIRSFNKQPSFISSNQAKLDQNQKAFFISNVANRWLGVRVEFIGTCVVSLAALFAVIERHNIDPGLAGLSISYALNITGTLNWLVRMSSETETQLVSVERVIQYLDIAVEAPPLIPHTAPPPDWPREGAITMSHLKLRYRPGLDLVLRGIDCEIKPREKIGVVGRTGAGKSSLMLALFRLVEPAEGTITIDGVDIHKLGLDTLRSRLSIIPQDPTLFTGTIRSNLDPFDQFPEEDLWYALNKVHLKSAVEAMGGLDAAVAEYGENLSVGQRQLMCLGRALLRRAKVLVMDEATAAVDYETDALIQRTIREEFVNVTVLTIAHRIQTIIDYDRILVLDQGLIAEFGPPAELLADSGGIFYSLLHSSGTASSEE